MGRPRTNLVVVAIFLLTSGTSCLFRQESPSYFPYLFGTGPTLDTHAKPRGRGYFADFDPHAKRLEVRPLVGSVPIGTDQVIIATIYDEDGKPRRGRRVEWLLEGPGSILEVDESGHLPGRGLKKDNKYAYGFTEYREHTVTRGNDNPGDDFTIRPGQSYCVVTCPVEGQTNITVYAPEIYDWDKHKFVVKFNWSDAQWEFPNPATVKTGTSHTFTTRVTRHSDRQPLAGYRIRYRLLDGPSAVVAQEGAQLTGAPQEAVAVSDSQGVASVDVRQLQPQNGINRVQVEVLKTDADGNVSVVAKSETKVNWQGPQLSVKVQVPKVAQLNQELPVLFTVTSTGEVEAQPMMLKTALPAGFEFVSSTAKVGRDGGQLLFAVPALGAGKQHSIQAILRPTKLGKADLEAVVPSADGQRTSDVATVQVTEAKLELTMIGPANVLVGETIPLELTLNNPGTGPANNVKVTLKLDEGMQLQDKTDPLAEAIPQVQGGEKRAITVPVVVTKPGRFIARATVSAESGLSSQAQPYQVDATQPQLSVETAGPAKVYVGQESTWTVTLRNQGQVPLTNVVATVNLPSEVRFVKASEKGESRGGQVVWNLGMAPPGGDISLELTVVPEQVNSKTFLTAFASADPLIQRKGEFRPASMQKRFRVDAPERTIEIQGIPAMTMQVQDAFDPIEVGKKSNYTIRVVNTGSLTSNQVELTAQIPPEFRPLRLNGPIQGRIDGQKVSFPPVESVKPGRELLYTIEVEAIVPGDARIRAELKGMSLPAPIRMEESTRVEPKPGSRPPPPPVKK